MKRKQLSMSWYKDFRCIGGSCPLTCCTTKWNIAVRDYELEMYQNMEHAFSKDIMMAIDIENKRFKGNEQSKCLMLTEDGWCQIVRNCGDRYLSETCIVYPRQFNFYGDVLECVVDVSCPEAASYLLDNQMIKFDYSEIDDEEEEAEKFDYIRYDALSVVRTFLVDLWMSFDKDYVLGKYFVMHHLYNKVKKKLENGMFRPEEAREMVEQYGSQANLTLMFQKAEQIAAHKGLRAAIVLKMILSTEAYVVQGGKRLFPDNMDFSYLHYWGSHMEEFESDMENFLAYYRAEYPYTAAKYFIYSLFLKWMKKNGEDDVFLSDDFLLKCIEFIWIQILAMASWKKEGRISDYPVIIASFERFFSHSYELKDKCYQAAASLGLTEEAKMLLMTLF